MEDICTIYPFAISVILTGIIIVVGFIGNLISFCILKKEMAQSDTLFLLSSLALVDFIFLIPAFFLFIIPNVAEQNDLMTTPTIAYLMKYVLPFASFCHTTTVWTTTLVTIHRYMAVCKANHKITKKLKSLNSTRIQLAIVIFCSFCFIIPRFFESDVKINITMNNTEKYIIVSSAFHKNKVYQIVYKTLLYHLIMFGIPLITLIVLTIKLLQFLKKRHKVRQSLNVKEKSEDNITFTLVVVVIVFIVCQTPTPISRVLFAIFGDKGKFCGHPYFYLERISDFLVVMNSSVNCIIYIACAQKFRRDLKRMCQSCICCKRNLRITPIEDQLSAGNTT